jgi:hypothetical protein
LSIAKDEKSRARGTREHGFQDFIASRIELRFRTAIATSSISTCEQNAQAEQTSSRGLGNSRQQRGLVKVQLILSVCVVGVVN